MLVDRNLLAVFAYEENLFFNGKALKVVKNELKVVDSLKNENTMARLMSLKIRSVFKTKVLSINELVEDEKAPLIKLNSGLFNSSSLKDYKKNLIEKIKEAEDIYPTSSRSGLKTDRLLILNEELKNVERLLKMNNNAWKGELDRMISNEEGVIISVDSNEKDKFHHLRFIAKNVNISIAVPMSGYSYFDAGFALGMLDKTLKTKKMS